MKISGGCHCRNISFVMNWPVSAAEIPARACGCTFCRKHGGVWTSYPGADLDAKYVGESAISKYKFGTETAEFYVCSGCGVVPFVISEIENRMYTVVNVNTFENIDPSSLIRSSADFEGERTDGRLNRRQQNWISNVRISRGAT